MFHNEDARKVPAKTSGRVAAAVLSREKYLLENQLEKLNYFQLERA